MAQIRKILCPLDFFPASQTALSYAITLAGNYDASLRIMHVIAPVLSILDIRGQTGQIVKAAHEEAERRLALEQEAAKSAGVRTSTEVRFGDVDQEILKATEEFKADLVVAATHGRRAATGGSRIGSSRTTIPARLR